MNQLDNRNENQPKSGRGNWAIPALAGAFALSLGINGYQGMRLQEVNQEVGSVHKQMSEIRSGLERIDQSLQDGLGAVKSQVDVARKDGKDSAGKAAYAAQMAARKHADQLVASLAKSEAEKDQQLSQELSQVKETATTATTKIADVTTDVGTVKEDVVKTRAELQGTIADLHRATGDMGVMSGLIATNGKELQALRELGDRNYVEFKLTRSDRPQKVGDILVAVRKTDAKRSKFTLDVIADDKKIEKKDKTANEPVQFYILSKARQPYELVVNEVTKDTVSGYLAVPKVQLSRK